MKYGISFEPYVNKKLIEACIQARFNEPYWAVQPKVSYDHDLRNPAFEKELEFVRRQMGV